MTSPDIRPKPITDYYHLPARGETVRIRGNVSTTYLRRGETMIIRWTDFWADLVVRNYVDIVGMVEEPAATEYFPSMAEVWALIEQAATTLPGEQILGMRAEDGRLIMTVGSDMASSREMSVEWPELETLLVDAVNLRDNTRDLADKAVEHLQAGIQELKNLLVDYNGIASAAAKVALDAAAEARATASESGKSAYEIAKMRGFPGDEDEWLASLKGEKGDVGPRGPQGEAGPQGPTGPQGKPGPQGEQGIQGVPGPAGNDGTSVSIEGTVGAATDLPSDLTTEDKGVGYLTSDDGHLHVWSGDSWVDVGTIRGPAGPAGPQGAPGPQGPQGLQGETGPQGAQGETGPQGAPGPQGETGPAGADGVTPHLKIGQVTKGDDPSASLTEQLGSYSLNLVLPKGDPGAAGEPGPAGVAGPAGADGVTPNFTIGTVNGGPAASAQITGTAADPVLNLVLPKGDPGEAGATGPMGPAGPTGPTGRAGADGKDYAAPGFTRGYFSFRDNGSINLGSGGEQKYYYRIDRKRCEIYFRIMWGSNASAGGGVVKIGTLPAAPVFTQAPEYYGVGSYYSTATKLRFPVQPVLIDGENAIKIFAPLTGTSACHDFMKVWDGVNGQNGLPGTGFKIDNVYSSLTGYIAYPVA